MFINAFINAFTHSFIHHKLLSNHAVEIKMMLSKLSENLGSSESGGKRKRALL